MLTLEQELLLQGKTTSAASGKCLKFPVLYNIAKGSFLICNLFTNNISVSFCFQSTSAKCSWPGEFIRWPTRLSYSGVYVLRSVFNLLQMKFLDSKSIDEQDTFQCHLLQSLKITSYSAPFLNRNEKVGPFPIIIWRRTSSSSYSKFLVP